MLLLIAILTTTITAQKPEKNKYEGHYKNIPAYQLNIDGYAASYSTPEWIEELIKKDTLDLQLKGFNKGNDLNIVFYCSEPELKASVEKETKKVNEQSVTTYYALVSARSESKVLVLNKEGLPIEIITTEPDYTWVNDKGFSRSNYDEAAKEMDKAKSSNGEKVKQKYIRALIKAYQIELDNRYGCFNNESTIRVFSIKNKKFDYSDFNTATQSFIEATTSSEINSDANTEKIKEAIAVWEQYANEYEAGKKSKVCDVNIDEINFNLAMGFLALGEGNQLKTYWEKCLAVKGNYTAEGYAKTYLPQMINNHEEYLAKKDQPLKPIDLTSEEQKYNDMILYKTILNFYFTQKHGNLGVISQYFPSQSQYITTTSTTKIYDEGTKETIKQSYSPYGKLNDMIYSVEGGMNDDKTRRYNFRYSNNQVSEVVLNGNLKLFTINYENNKISEIIHHFSNSKRVIYKFNMTEPGKTEIHISVAEGEKIQESKRVNWVKFDKDYHVTGIYISPFMTKELKYDKHGNIVEITAVNLADNTFTMPFTVEADEKGNAIQIDSNGLKVTSSYEYIF